MGACPLIFLIVLITCCRRHELHNLRGLHRSLGNGVVQHWVGWPGTSVFRHFDTLEGEWRRKSLKHEETDRTRVMALVTVAWSRERFLVNFIAESKLRKISRKQRRLATFCYQRTFGNKPNYRRGIWKQQISSRIRANERVIPGAGFMIKISVNSHI